MSFESNTNTEDKFGIKELTNFGKNGNEIADTDVYSIIDMELKDFEGFVKQTISRTTLYPNQKTRGHTHEDANETYYFIAGNGLILLQSENMNELFHIESETWLYIPKKTFHMVINTSKNENLEFMTFYPGPSARPPITVTKEEKKKK